MVKEAMINWEGGCRCPPEFPECRCGRVPLLRRVHKKGIKPTPRKKKITPAQEAPSLGRQKGSEAMIRVIKASEIERKRNAVQAFG
jgi:hypothetical protein